MAFPLDVLQKYSRVMHRKVILKQQTCFYYTFERYFLAVNQITNGIHAKHKVKLNKYNVIIQLLIIILAIASGLRITLFCAVKCEVLEYREIIHFLKKNKILYL